MKYSYKHHIPNIPSQYIIEFENKKPFRYWDLKFLKKDFIIQSIKKKINNTMTIKDKITLKESQRRALEEVGYFYFYIKGELMRINKNNLWLLSQNT
jgi:hypothetical protein